MKRILSGMQPTGNLHIGNYLGALKNWVALQAQGENFFCIVDLHAMTLPYDPARLADLSRETAAAYLAAGVDPARAALFVQSSVQQHAELNWIFSTLTPLGWLERMTQYKDKAKTREQEKLGLFAYPVLMAADILLYHTSHVPVGEDQKQHLELARDIAGAFNRQFATDFFPLPEPQILGEATRVMSLRDGTKKMSKSDESDYSRINLTDDAETIALKIRKAKTDPQPLPALVADLAARPEADNLVAIYAGLANRSKQAVLAEYGGAQFSTFKSALADLAVAELAPIAARLRELLADPAELDRLLRVGRDRALAVAVPVMERVRQLVGLWRP